PRMRVGAQPPRAPGSAFLLLGLALGAAAQLSCVGDTYPSGSRCCKECQPGYGMESRCTQAQDTVCRPCEPGFYNEAVNYEACKPCTQCNQRSGSEPKQRCTPTRDTVCGCRPGTQPQDGYGYKRGVGEGCLWNHVEGACPSHAVTSPQHPDPRLGRVRPRQGLGGSQVVASGWHVGREGLLEALGGERLGPPGVADGQSLLTLLQTVPRAHQDTSPRATTRPASPGPRKRTLQAASNSSDAVCEDRTPRLTPAWETQGPAARSTPVQPTTTWPRASQGPSTPHAEPPKGKGAWPRPSRALPQPKGCGVAGRVGGAARWPGCGPPAVDSFPGGPHPSGPCLPAGPELAAVLGLGLGLGLLGPVAAALALLLHHRAWRPTPNAPKPPGANSFRTPIQEEHADANSSLAKI
ncbi:hypothetical protein EI555_019431, partial [Monodon monoceros]